MHSHRQLHCIISTIVCKPKNDLTFIIFDYFLGIFPFHVVPDFSVLDRIKDDGKVIILRIKFCCLPFSRSQYLPSGNDTHRLPPHRMQP